jgi:hypothetical protein
MRPVLALVVLALAGCGDVAIDCASFSTWEECPIEEGCGWGDVEDRGWSCVLPCETDDDCAEGSRCTEVGSGSGRGDGNVRENGGAATFLACVE